MPMLKHEIELAYSFFHQKQRVYQYSTMEWQKEDIEYAIAQYVEGMNSELYAMIAYGRKDYLLNHSTFPTDIVSALEVLEGLLTNN